MGNLNSTELAHKLSVSKQSISAYLNGTRKPKRNSLAEIARLLDVDPAWLMGYDVPMQRVTENNLKANCNLYAECTQKSIPEVVSLLLQLDESDRILIKGEIIGLLKQDKYQLSQREQVG